VQQWYEETAERTTPQTRTLQEFLASHDRQLPQITEDHKDMLDNEFTTTEMQDALNDANEVSAPGPSGQNIAFYKLLFAEIPNIMTRAINQIVFVPRLNETLQFKWINGYSIERSSTFRRNRGQPAPLTIGLSACWKSCTKYHHKYLLKDSAKFFPQFELEQRYL
jgi:hypothetical protein